MRVPRMQCTTSASIAIVLKSVPRRTAPRMSADSSAPSTPPYSARTPSPAVLLRHILLPETAHLHIHRFASSREGIHVDPRPP